MPQTALPHNRTSNPGFAESLKTNQHNGNYNDQNEGRSTEPLIIEFIEVVVHKVLQ